MLIQAIPIDRSKAAAGLVDAADDDQARPQQTMVRHKDNFIQLPDVIYTYGYIGPSAVRRVEEIHAGSNE